MKKILFSLAMVAGFSAVNAQTVIFEDGFEDYEDFTIDNFGGWTQLDLDGGTTWGSEDVDFPNEGYVGAGIIFNLSQATVLTTGDGYATHSGDKGLYFFASGAGGSAFPNDDWTISPQISLEGVTGAKLELYAKALTDQYGPDLFEIGISTTGTQASDFTFIGTLTQPTTEFDLYEFDLSAYDGQNIHIGINCTTDDGFVLLIDDFKVTGETLGVSDLNKNVSAVYPNPVVDTFNVNLSSKFNVNNVTVTLTDMTGKTVRTFGAASSYNVSDLAAGVYVVKITDGQNTETKKIVKK